MDDTIRNRRDDGSIMCSTVVPLVSLLIIYIFWRGKVPTHPSSER